jgi:peptidyl-dipeptidase Dcp
MLIRTAVFITLMVALPVVPVGQQPAAPAGESNPLLTPWTTPFGVPPFGEIRPEHFLPATKRASPGSGWRSRRL